MGESENILQTVKRIVQDFVAPDVRELKVRVAALQEQTKAQFEAVQSQFDALGSQIATASLQSEAQYKALLAAISQSRAEAELANFRGLAALGERVAALEAARQ